MSDVCDRIRVWVGFMSAAAEKSRSSLLRKRCKVLGAVGESEERTKMECSFRTPAKLRAC